MSLPPETLLQLSPASAKLYLCILNLADTRSPIPLATAPLKKLIQHSALSRRTCLRSLAQLKSLSLLLPLPKHRNKPFTYLLPALPLPKSPATPQKPKVPPMAPHPAKVPPVAPTNSVPAVANPLPTPKNPTSHPQRSTLNALLGATPGTSLANSHLLHQLLSQLTRAQVPPPTPEAQ